MIGKKPVDGKWLPRIVPGRHRYFRLRAAQAMTRYWNSAR